MIVWLASFPRSGNTYLRIVLHHLLGVSTYSIYDDDDPVAQRIGPALVGYHKKPDDRQAMIASPEVYFTKTHKRHKGDSQKAIYLVRDGRDAAVSLAHLNMSDAKHGGTALGFDDHLRRVILRPFDPTMPSSGGWGGHVLNWVNQQHAKLAVIKYEQLVTAPIVYRALNELELDVVRSSESDIPTFDQLHKVDAGFFRRGQIGSYRQEMSQQMQTLFWDQAENALAMEVTGYDR